MKYFNGTKIIFLRIKVDNISIIK
jgi:hypothetical protein